MKGKNELTQKSGSTNNQETPGNTSPCKPFINGCLEAAPFACKTLEKLAEPIPVTKISCKVADNVEVTVVEGGLSVEGKAEAPVVRRVE